MKRIVILVLFLLLIPTYVKAATLIENLEVESSKDYYTFSMERTSWAYTLFTDQDNANIKVTPKAGVTVTGAGVVPVNEGLNKIEFSATDGNNTENYTLNLNVVKTEIGEDGQPVNPPTGDSIPLITIGMLLIIGCLVTLGTRKASIYRI